MTTHQDTATGSMSDTSLADVLVAELSLAGLDVRQHHWPASPGRRGVWPAWLPSDVVEELRGGGVGQPWQHQVDAADAAVSGLHVMLATGTSSGKSLGYLMPVLAATYGGPDAVGPRPPGDRPPDQHRAVLDDLLGRDRIEASEILLDRRSGINTLDRRPHTAIYLAPTKALAHDQFRAAQALGPRNWGIATLDGDTTAAARDWVREWGTYVLSNPDMLHYSVLPQHRRWAPLLRRLRYVVVDEAHRYRGVFGAHVAAVLARLRRIAHHYGADPVFLLAAATTATPAQSAAQLIGVAPERIVVIDRDDSSRPARRLLHVEPTEEADEVTAGVLARCVSSGRQAIAFTRSRRAAEVVASRARELCPGGLGARIEAYRAGYLAADRRTIERGLSTGDVRGVASTNALELGVDIVGLDAVVIDGFPGTRSSFWQQAGRAGRREGAEALVVLVAGRHPLDRFLFAHPAALLDQPVETTVLHRENPCVLMSHLLAAAQESPLRDGDARYFGPTIGSLLAGLERTGAVRQRPDGWYATGTGSAAAAIDLRAAGECVDLVEESTGRVIEVVDAAAADLCAHEGAVYVHRGDTYLCRPAEHGEPEVLVRAARPGYLTSPRRMTEVRLLAERRRRPVGAGLVSVGTVEVRSRVTGYLRRDPRTGAVWDHTPLDLPERALRTMAVWWTLDRALVDEEIGLTRLPAYASCDPWDVSGAAAVTHPDTGMLTVIVYDALPGGAGFADRGYAVAERWLAATAGLLSSCECDTGCPACVISASCGSTGRPLDKGVATLLASLMAEPAGSAAP